MRDRYRREVGLPLTAEIGDFDFRRLKGRPFRSVPKKSKRGSNDDCIKQGADA